MNVYSISSKKEALRPQTFPTGNGSDRFNLDEPVEVVTLLATAK